MGVIFFSPPPIPGTLKIDRPNSQSQSQRTNVTLRGEGTVLCRYTPPPILFAVDHFERGNRQTSVLGKGQLVLSWLPAAKRGRARRLPQGALSVGVGVCAHHAAEALGRAICETWVGQTSASFVGLKETKGTPPPQKKNGGRVGLANIYIYIYTYQGCPIFLHIPCSTCATLGRSKASQEKKQEQEARD